MIMYMEQESHSKKLQKDLLQKKKREKTMSNG